MKIKKILLICGLLFLSVFLHLTLKGETPATMNETLAQTEIDTVIIKGMQFHPANVKVHKGSTIVWINKGVVAHNVADDPDRKWKSKDFKPGESWKMVAEKSGKYICTIHPTMKGEITIIED